MITFREYIQEQQRLILGTLNIFDIDDTLFHTTAKIKVLSAGKVVRELSNRDYNTYTLKSGESYDYSQFRDAEKFRQESTPIDRMINKAKIIIDRQRSPLSKTIIITARANFDKKEVFLQKFKDHGFPIQDVYVERAGNIIGDKLPADKKVMIISKYLDTNNYVKVRLFDDSMANLKAFLSMKSYYSNIEFEAYLANEDGTVKTIKA